jgi:hypothetical protein
MRRFLNRLMREFRSIKTARPAHRAPRRASLQVEGLEDRLVLSTATIYRASLPPLPMSTVTLQGSTLAVDALANRLITFMADRAHAGDLDVYDGTLSHGTSLLWQGPSASVKQVLVSVAGNDVVDVHGDNGLLPFASGATFALSGSGALNYLVIESDDGRAVSGDEFYNAGGTAAQASSLSLGGATFEFNNAITRFSDYVPITGTLYVATTGHAVSLATFGWAQTLNGLGPSGGSTLDYGYKPSIELEANAANASVSLNATAGAAGEQSFALHLTAINDRATISATPSSVTTTVGLYDSGQSVNLMACSGPVNVVGDAWSFANDHTAVVSLGQAAPHGGWTTAGIRANVNVTDVAMLVVNDNGNVTTQEHVTVSSATQNSMTISGQGLFGNGQVQVKDAIDLPLEGGGDYSFAAGASIDDHFGEVVPTVSIRTGQLADTYDVVASAYGAFGDFALNIDDFSKGGLNVVASEATAGTDLYLILNNTFLAHPAAANVFLSAPPGASFSHQRERTYPDASVVTWRSVDVAPKWNAELFGIVDGFTNQVAYNGFTVTHS